MKKFKFMFFTLLTFILFIFNGCKGTSVKNIPENPPVKIGLSWEREFPEDDVPEDTQAYIDAVKAVGAIPVLLSEVTNEKEAKEALKSVDALILTGGEDIDPKLYGEKPHENLEELKKDRDNSDYLLTKIALEKDFPILGTCRGMQMLNIALGGTLYQDLPTEYISNVSDISHRDPKKENFAFHSINIIDKNSKLYKMLETDEITVNSWHHQGIKTLGKGLKVTAKSPDGIIEAVELENAYFVVGVQFHPEWHIVENDKEFLPVLEALKEAGFKRRK